MEFVSLMAEGLIYGEPDPVGFTCDGADLDGSVASKNAFFTVSATNIYATFQRSFGKEHNVLNSGICSRGLEPDFENIKDFLEELNDESFDKKCCDPISKLDKQLKRKVRFGPTLLERFFLILLLPFFFLFALIYEVLRILYKNGIQKGLGVLVRVSLKLFCGLSICTPTKDNRKFANIIKKLAYSCNRVEKSDPRTRGVVKLLGFAGALELMDSKVGIEEFSTSSKLTVEESNNGAKIRERLLKELEGRLALEIGAPQILFKKVFGRFCSVGEVREDPEFSTFVEAVEYQERCLEYLCKMKLSNDVNKSGEDMLPMVGGMLYETIPIRLHSDLSRLFPKAPINFDLKTNDSIKGKMRFLKKGKDDGTSVKMNDLVRCRVIIDNMYATWSTLVPSLLASMDKMYLKGVTIKMQNVDKEPCRYTDEAGEEVYEMKWPGLKLKLYYKNFVVEVQVMSSKTLLSYGNRLSHDIRDAMKGKESV